MILKLDYFIVTPASELQISQLFGNDVSQRTKKNISSTFEIFDNEHTLRAEKIPIRLSLCNVCTALFSLFFS